jgi:hypothetical protein
MKTPYYFAKTKNQLQNNNLIKCYFAVKILILQNKKIYFAFLKL